MNDYLRYQIENGYIDISEADEKEAFDEVVVALELVDDMYSTIQEELRKVMEVPMK